MLYFAGSFKVNSFPIEYNVDVAVRQTHGYRLHGR